MDSCLNSPSNFRPIYYLSFAPLENYSKICPSYNSTTFNCLDKDLISVFFCHVPLLLPFFLPHTHFTLSSNQVDLSVPASLTSKSVWFSSPCPSTQLPLYPHSQVAPVIPFISHPTSSLSWGGLISSSCYIWCTQRMVTSWCTRTSPLYYLYQMSL